MRDDRYGCDFHGPALQILAGTRPTVVALRQRRRCARNGVHVHHAQPTADTTQDDPTIRRCKNFATALGASTLVVANLYAYRATNPKTLRGVDDPVGPDNDTYLKQALAARHVIVAWGAHAEPGRVSNFQALAGTNTPLWCLGTTKTGAPRHPLYVPSGTHLQPWSAA